MARSVDVNLQSTVEDAARAASGALRGELEDALAGAAREIVRGAQGRVPVLTGAARASLRVEPADEGARIVAGGTQAPYFHILEYGSKFVRGGHHLGKATGAALGDIEQAALQAATDAARRGGFTVG
ncbi:MAG TPA: HK97 gp10 family phage protein [Acidimicrobiia bacterium]|nr:HK97 gp10 family phage protein [Acidimicrobiia bacterium]